MRLEKREVEAKLEETRHKLQLTNALMEKNEQKLKEDDDVLRAELNALRQTLLINLGLADGAQSEQLNILSEKMDSESNEIIESFKQLQSNTREYLKSLKDNENPDSSYELSIKVKNASQVWQKNLQTLAIKFTSAQSKITDLTTKNELLVKAKETEVSDLEAKISRLREELDKQKISQELNNINNDESLSEQSTILNNSIGNSKLNSNEFNESILSQNDEIKKEESGPPKLFEDPDESDEEEAFVYPVNPSESLVNENKESTSQAASAKSTLADDDDNNVTGNGAASFLALERDMSGRKDDDAKQRENLIKKHYECKITQLTEQLQLADSKATRFYKAIETLQSRLANAESKNAKLQKELAKSNETFTDERKNHQMSIDTMQKYIAELSDDKVNLTSQLNQLKAGPSSRAM